MNGSEQQIEPPFVDRKECTEDYKIWKKHTPLFYDLVQTRILPWPSLVVEWLPNRQLSNSGDDCAKQSVLVGTQSTGRDDFISSISFRLPKKETVFDLHYDELTGGLGGFGVVPSGFEETEYRLTHPGPVLAAKAMPQDPKFVASQSEIGILIFNTEGYQPYFSLTEPQLAKGFSWNPNKKGVLMYCSAGEIFEFDFDNRQGIKTLTCPTWVQSVECHQHHATIYSAYGQGIQIGDTRPSTAKVIDINHNHLLPITGFAWNPLNEFMFAECSSDKKIGIWDLRMIQSPLHQMEHDSPVNGVQWSPFVESVLGSADDKKILLWNLADVGKAQTPQAKQDGPPELLFIHRGHSDKINDFSWNPSDNWVIASVASNNILQVWKLVCIKVFIVFSVRSRQNIFITGRVSHSFVLNLFHWIIQNLTASVFCVEINSRSKVFVVLLQGFGFHIEDMLFLLLIGLGLLQALNFPFGAAVEFVC